MLLCQKKRPRIKCIVSIFFIRNNQYICSAATWDQLRENEQNFPENLPPSYLEDHEYTLYLGIMEHCE